MEWVYHYTQHMKALKYLREEYGGRKLSYREMAEVLTALTGEPIQKSSVWNAMNRPGKCPKIIRVGLEYADLLGHRPRRRRFFYNVGTIEHEEITEYLANTGMTFTECIRSLGVPPWEI